MQSPEDCCMVAYFLREQNTAYWHRQQPQEEQLRCGTGGSVQGIQ